jgi:hypothetical protein
MGRDKVARSNSVRGPLTGISCKVNSCLGVCTPSRQHPGLVTYKYTVITIRLLSVFYVQSYSVYYLLLQALLEQSV